MRAIIDTCVILDYLQCREPFFDDALNIAIGSANREYEAYISANSMTDLYYIIHKYTHDDNKTRKYLSDLFELPVLLDSFGMYPVIRLVGGRLKFGTVYFGDKKRRRLKYIDSCIRRVSGKRDTVFITYFGIKESEINEYKNRIIEKTGIENVIILKASAASSANCGPSTLGVLW